MCFPSEWYLFQVKEKNKTGKNKCEALTSKMAAPGGVEHQQGDHGHLSWRATGHTIMLKHKYYIKGLSFHMFENIHVEMHVAMDTGLPLEQ